MKNKTIWKSAIIDGEECDDLQISNKGGVKLYGNILPNNTINTHGSYKYVYFKGKSRTIHRLVAEAFLPHTKEQNIVHHKNFNKTDNSVDNLVWLTEEEHGSIHHPDKVETLPVETVLQICELVKENKFTYKEIHQKTGVDVETIYRIVNKGAYIEYTYLYLQYFDNYKFRNIRRPRNYKKAIIRRIKNRDSREDIINWMEAYEPDRLRAERYYDAMRQRYLKSINANMDEEDGRYKYRMHFQRIEKAILDGDISKSDLIKTVQSEIGLPYMKAKDLVKQRREALISGKNHVISIEGREKDIKRLIEEDKKLGHMYDEHIPYVKEQLAFGTRQCDIVKALMKERGLEKIKAKNLVAKCKKGMEYELSKEDEMYRGYIPLLEYKIIKGEKNKKIKDWLLREEKLDESSIETIIKSRRKIIKEEKGIIQSLFNTNKTITELLRISH